jgi:acetate kinase
MGVPMPSPDAAIAVINAGSSSIKFAFYEAEPTETALFRGQVEKIGVAPHMRITDAKGAVVAEKHWDAKALDHRQAAKEVLKTAADLIRGTKVLAVGHRVVHGGTRYSKPIKVDEEARTFLATLNPLAPLHQPINLAVIAAVDEAAPHLPQVACFDTAFHRTQPHLAQLFALPRKFTEAGVRRYGFHGLSYEYVSSRLLETNPELKQARVVMAHLGNGASLCAMHHGQSVACTMAFTALDGLVMGTRCGPLDPGVLLHLMDAYGMDARAIEDLLYRKSGLLGVSGVSSDMRDLHNSSEPAAAEAVSLFVYRLVREIASAAAAMGGMDALVFTGGIGENDVAVRKEVAEGCRWLGLEVDEMLNAVGYDKISKETSRVSAWIIPTNEEYMVAQHTAEVISSKSAKPLSYALRG